ncbi:putative heparinase superfamily protein [Microvirga flocculans]|uniref:Putative heparinase superfamily protein n=1 Tax=Microvirga flocculans TaxID=217168 RepID=A0A7W6II08_9HYPH|nr:heparinase II/III family protein [Microvirga flocculans]MBB4041275.1 putative heparinase superfamily protein [Microvirga flocculans]
MDFGPDRWRLYGLAVREAGRAMRESTVGVLSRLSGAPMPTRLLFAPQDLRTADPTVATDIYSGFFAFSGRAITTGGRSPFAFAPPSRAWGEALYGFGWLRHLRAAGTALAQANARSLVDEFVTSRLGDRRIACSPEVTARRLMSFISQSPLILEGADHAFYQRFLKLIGQHVSSLERQVRSGALPYQQLMAAIALCYAGLCCEGLDRNLKRASRLLARELDRQILADGGHASRNPRIIVELLFDLLPLRQMFASREVDTPEALLRSIDRILPMVRLFRHGDGTLSHFNGMGVTAADHLATLLTYDDMRSQAIHHAPHSGYERLEAGRTLVVADVGAPPPRPLSQEAGAGCLSFEFSSAAQRIVVNCGMPQIAGDAIIQASRSTVAHSTASIDDVSSCQIVDKKGNWLERRISAWLLRRVGPVVLSGPEKVTAERGEREHVQILGASHDGYKARFGIVHERRWLLAPKGNVLEGEDTFLSEGGQSARAQAIIRFHLAPGIKASRAQGGRVVMLVLPNREAWQFSATPVEAELEDSVFLATADGMRRTEQIVLTVRPGETPTVRWRFERMARTFSAEQQQEQTPELI